MKATFNSAEYQATSKYADCEFGISDIELLHQSDFKLNFRVNRDCEEEEEWQLAKTALGHTRVINLTTGRKEVVAVNFNVYVDENGAHYFGGCERRKCFNLINRMAIRWGGENKK